MRLDQLGVRLVLLLFACSAGSLQAQNTVLGDWQTSVGAIVHLAPCGDAVCFKIARFAVSRLHPKDGKNKDSALRGRDLCGLTIGTGFRADGQNHYAGGEIYDPDTKEVLMLEHGYSDALSPLACEHL